MKTKTLPFVSDAAAWESAVTADHLCRWAGGAVCLRSPRSLELASTSRQLFPPPPPPPPPTELQSKACLTLAFIINLKKTKKSAPKTNLVLNSKSCWRLWTRLLVPSSSCRKTNWRRDTHVKHSVLTSSNARVCCWNGSVSFWKSKSPPVECSCSGSLAENAGWPQRRLHPKHSSLFRNTVHEDAVDRFPFSPSCISESSKCLF